MSWNINARNLLSFLAGLAFLATLAAPAIAVGSAAVETTAATPTRFARVSRISGSLTATPPNTTSPRTLQAGDPVYVGERIEAAADGQALLQTADAGYIAVRPGARFAMEQFVAEKSPDDRFALRLLQGGLRLVTGWVARLHPTAYRITTPSAAVGVRGTDHETHFLDEQQAKDLKQAAGTYDKVNRGATALQANGGSVDIAVGQVGFARLASPRKTRALITLVLPTLLEKVPSFYVPGAFDAELDALPPLAPLPASNVADSSAFLPSASTANSTQAASPGNTPSLAESGRCNATTVANDWIGRLDKAMVQRDAAAVLALFAPGATVSATVQSKGGGTDTVTLSREEFAASSVAALKQLSQFSQRRLSVAASDQQTGDCAQIAVHSEVQEQGLQDGKPYGFRTSESYELELRDGQWLAAKASTRQY